MQETAHEAGIAGGSGDFVNVMVDDDVEVSLKKRARGGLVRSYECRPSANSDVVKVIAGLQSAVRWYRCDGKARCARPLPSRKG